MYHNKFNFIDNQPIIIVSMKNNLFDTWSIPMNENEIIWLAYGVLGNLREDST